MCLELLYFSKLNRIGRAYFSACWFEPFFQPIIAKRAFVRFTVSVLITCNHTEWTCNYTIATSITNILLYVDRIKLSADNRSCRTCLQTWRVRTMFTYITLHQPTIATEKWQGSTL